MIKEFIEKWWEYKDNLEAYFRGVEDISKITYENIVTALIRNVLNGGIVCVGFSDNITVIDHGDCQGTQIFVIHNQIYQPSITDYFFTHNYYGSCSGCDTLLSIIEFSNGTANEDEIKGLMQLAFDLLRNIKPFVEDAEFDYGFIHLTEGDQQ